MKHLICPKCSQPLCKKDKSLVCQNNHTFDISKKGHVNLLLSSGSSKNHGDDKDMIYARRDFLGKGFYDRLSEALCALCAEHCGCGLIVDAGCGEGKYTKDIERSLAVKDIPFDIYAFDVSKEAILCAANRSENITFFVASSSDIPLKSSFADIVLCIFSPLMKEEFSRILKDNGKLIVVYPLAYHLFELKSSVYEHPYENEPQDPDIEDFRIVSQQEIKYEIELTSNSDIQNLFKMTPYYYKTSKNDMEKLLGLDFLKTRVEFGITVYEKIKK